MPKNTPIVLVNITEGDLQRPDFFRMIGCEVILGRPKATPTSVNYVVLLDLPKERTSFEVLNRLKEVGIGIIAPHALADALHLMTLPEALSSQSKLAILVNYEDSLEELTRLEPALVILKYDSSHDIESFSLRFKFQIPLILHGSEKVVSLFKQGYGQGIWVDAAGSLETRCNLSLQLLSI